MDKYNSSRTLMLKTTVQLCRKNKPITDTVPAMDPVLQTIETKLILVDNLNQIGTSPTQGVTIDTKLLRKAMTMLTLKSANALAAYASVTKKNELFEKTNHPEAFYNELRKDDADDASHEIHTLGEKHLKEAADYGYNAADLDNLKTAISLYRTAMQDPRQAIITSSQAKKQAKEILKDTINNNLNNQLDKMVNTLQTTQPNFYNKYQQARIIIQIGSRTDEKPPATPQ